MNDSFEIVLGDKMGTPPSDLVIKIDYRDTTGSAARVFDIASELIRSFEDLDGVLITSIDTKISTQLILEDIEKSSIKIFLRNLLKEADDQALKDLDWKPQVGKYLVKAKYAALQWLDRDIDEEESVQIEDLTEKFRALAQETDVRHVPDYPKLNSSRVAQSLDRIQRTKERFKDGESLTITLDETEYSVDLQSKWMPSEHMPDVEAAQELSNEIDMVLIIRKPDLLGQSQWQFKHGKNNFNAPIEDEQWLEEFHAGKHPITPGQALRVRVRHDYKYDELGNLKDSDQTIVRVLAVLQTDKTGDLFDA
ncbi:hypothetical protein [Coralliovum pocilloporae]|uniref:hypothetical protein n=1 Tax=Coralliovum pocilloporae TaxID=3066369 RepID=UPI0033078B88